MAIGEAVVTKVVIQCATGIVTVVLLGFVLVASAQVKVGENLSMDLNGQVSAGYTADYGDLISSDHGITLGGNANLTGFYYDPNFISFSVDPYYNQSRANSNFQSISDASGVNATTNLFSGSKFPGSVSYSKNYNSEGTFGIPGVPGYTTNGNGDVLSIGWAANLTGYPSLVANFLEGHSAYSIYGQNAEGTSAFHSFNINSSYQIAGFNLNGGYTNSVTHSEFPFVFLDQQSETSDQDSKSFFVGANHTLPLYGNFAVNFSRGSFNSDFGQFQYSGTVNTVSANASFHPLNKLDLGVTTNYTDNLLGTLLQTVITAGGVVQQSTLGVSSNAFDVTGFANYKLREHINLNASIDHRDQSFLGVSATADNFTGTATYWTQMLGGSFSATGGGVASTSNSISGAAVGLIGSANFYRKYGAWNTAVSGHYAQNVQTALVGYTTSNYGFSGNVGRNFGRKYSIGFGAGLSKNLLNNFSGYGSSNQFFTASLSTRWVGMSGTYSKYSGSSLLAGTGLIPTPLPLPVPTDVIFYGGRSYGLGLGSNPTRHLTLSASYAKSFSDTQNSTIFSNNSTETVNARLQYQYRQLYFNAGWSKLVQGFSATGLPPAMLGSYYFGIQRWFNFF